MGEDLKILIFNEVANITFLLFSNTLLFNQKTLSATSLLIYLMSYYNPVLVSLPLSLLTLVFLVFQTLWRTFDFFMSSNQLSRTDTVLEMNFISVLHLLNYVQSKNLTMSVNMAKPKRWTQTLQAECEWQSWHFFSKGKKTEDNWPYLFVQSGNKITEQASEHRHSDSLHTWPYFVILVRQIEDSQQNYILKFITGFICMLNYGFAPIKVQ